MKEDVNINFIIELWSKYSKHSGWNFYEKVTKNFPTILNLVLLISEWVWKLNRQSQIKCPCFKGLQPKNNNCSMTHNDSTIWPSLLFHTAQQVNQIDSKVRMMVNIKHGE